MNITINERALPVIKAGLSLEEGVLNLSLNKYQKQLTEFEKKHRFGTEDFLLRFNSGKLGDDSEWFDWLFAYKSVQYVKENLLCLQEIKW